MPELPLATPNYVVIARDGKESTVTRKAFENVFKSDGYKLVRETENESEIDPEQPALDSPKATGKAKSGRATKRS